jgi:hypothetical protein
MATFITSKSVGQTITVTIETSTGWWKYNHNGTFAMEGNGSKSVQVLNANGEFTITSCDIDGTPDGVITELDLRGNALTSFDGTGLSSLTILNLGSIIDKNGFILASNNLTSFDGTGLSSLTMLNLQHNPLVTFIGGDLQLLSTIDLRNRGFSSFDGWNITTLESIDITGMDNLRYLYVENNTSINNASVNNSLLAKLAANELANDWDSGEFYTTGGRTSAGTDDYDYLINEGWTVTGADLVEPTPTFITSKAVEQFISLDIETTEGYWKYLHDGVWSEPFETGSYKGNFEIEITNENGEFTLVSCDFEGTETGDITYLDLNSQELTSFDGTGLTSLTELYLYSNQLTEFDGTDLSSLTYLDLNSNQLTTLDISNMDYLQNLYVNDNLLTASVNNSLLTKLAANELSNGWTYGEFYTTGGRTSAGTDDYDYLITNSWDISGADLLVARKLRVRGINQQN